MTFPDDIRFDPSCMPPGSARARVVVAMSGGVDSSVTAAMLKAAGYDVVGITLQLYDQGGASGRPGACCAGRDIQDARSVAERIGIPHYVLDYEDRFSEAVIEQFAESYLAGETPVPCIACNQKIKFTALLDTATELGAAVLATGHYVRCDHSSGQPVLLRAADADRDQSYFLFSTTAGQLRHLSFPLGGLRKAQVRVLAEHFGLGVARKADSQDICFVANGRYGDFIAKLRPSAIRPGDIVHIDGRHLGRHKGIVRYTIGQRRGLGLSTPEPLFVVDLDAANDRVVVGPRSALQRRIIRLRDVNWLGSSAYGPAQALHARIRSSQAPEPASLQATPEEVANARATVVLDEGAFGVSPGQACVFYSDATASARILGGGWIESAQADMKSNAADISQATGNCGAAR